MRLPTDTIHLRLQTRQYELFGRSLGRGVERRILLIGTVSVGLWWSVLLVLGMPILHRLSPLVFLVPPVVFVLYGTRRDDTGRMMLAAWRDWAQFRMQPRRAVIGNPLLDITGHRSHPIRLLVTTRLVTSTPESGKDGGAA
ncbi:hypothetical protein ADK67_14715 [Saccharothrix sp. NRRL B-16348]|uniref:hypothetical protein n=1 Tax=Saccharothrix sp. NRRL B-16348 TaxID=1415542 RepID=UPI0006B05AE6|nr:hypothetical protein [Saccharothrix sp. NRRL B-16348]KOX27073.1 hypothetical protein ADK67_14715 [Saccharothrix sp. NRRL B-16348]